MTRAQRRLLPVERFGIAALGLDEAASPARPAIVSRSRERAPVPEPSLGLICRPPDGFENQAHTKERTLP